MRCTHLLSLFCGTASAVTVGWLSNTSPTGTAWLLAIVFCVWGLIQLHARRARQLAIIIILLAAHQLACCVVADYFFQTEARVNTWMRSGATAIVCGGLLCMSCFTGDEAEEDEEAKQQQKKED